VKEKNKSILKKSFPRLWEIYLNAPNSPDIVPMEAKNSKPVFKYKDAAFHGIYKPEEEASRFSANIPTDLKNIWVFGLGYGYHLREILNRDAKITICEPSPEIFKSAVENADLAAILERCSILVGKDILPGLEKELLKGARIFPHRPYVRFFEQKWKQLSTAIASRSLILDKNLKVMVIGPIYGGSEPTFRYTCAALTRMGVNLVPFDSSKFAESYFKVDGLNVSSLHRTQLNAIFIAMLGDAAAAVADKEKPDLILALAQAPLGVETLMKLKALKTPLAFWFVEDFRTMTYWEQVAGFYDFFFTIQRGPFLDKLEAVGVTKAAYLPQACSPEDHKPLKLTSGEKNKYGSDLSFMGAGYYNRRKFFNGLLDYDFKIWGTEWDLDSPVGKKVANANKRVAPEEYIKIFSASKINLNLHSSTMLEGIDPKGDFVNPRVFELAACGAFSLVDPRSELGALFEVGSEVVTFESLADLRDKIDHYLADEDARLKIASAARERALVDHSFERRMESLLGFIISCEGSSFPRRTGRQEPKARNPRNIVGTMIKEASDIPELVNFLQQLDPEKEINVKEIVAKMKPGETDLSWVASIMVIMDEFIVNKKVL
jgi:spore maturation protein CgeB